MVFSGKETGTLFPALPGCFFCIFSIRGRVLLAQSHSPREGHGGGISVLPPQHPMFPEIPGSFTGSLRNANLRPPSGKKEAGCRENIRPGKKGTKNPNLRGNCGISVLRYSTYTVERRFSSHLIKKYLYLYTLSIFPPFRFADGGQWNYIDPANREDAAP